MINLFRKEKQQKSLRNQAKVNKVDGIITSSSDYPSSQTISTLLVNQNVTAFPNWLNN